METKFK